MEYKDYEIVRDTRIPSMITIVHAGEDKRGNISPDLQGFYTSEQEACSRIDYHIKMKAIREAEVEQRRRDAAEEKARQEAEEALMKEAYEAVAASQGETDAETVSDSGDEELPKRKNKRSKSA